MERQKIRVCPRRRSAAIMRRFALRANPDLIRQRGVKVYFYPAFSHDLVFASDDCRRVAAAEAVDFLRSRQSNWGQRSGKYVEGLWRFLQNHARTDGDVIGDNAQVIPLLAAADAKIQAAYGGATDENR